MITGMMKITHILAYSDNEKKTQRHLMETIVYPFYDVSILYLYILSIYPELIYCKKDG